MPPPEAHLKIQESATGGDGRQEELPYYMRFEVAVLYPVKQEYHFQELPFPV
jgi:hypothetical protein